MPVKDAIEQVTALAKAKTDQQLLDLFLELEAIQWAAVSNDDREEADDYRTGLLRLLKKYCGKYEAIKFRRELAFNVVELRGRQKTNSIAKHINAVTANDWYLEGYEIILESIQEAKREGRA